MNSISVDVIIINFNSTDYTIRCIESVKENVKIDQLKFIVVDNKSNDAPGKIVRRYPDIKLILNSLNMGFGKAINIALKSTTSKYILLLNPDTEIKDKTFTNIFNYMEERPEVSAAGPMVLDQDGSLQGSARKFPTTWTSIFGRKSPLTKMFPNNPITKREFLCFNGDNNSAIDVDWISGACMIIRKKAIHRIGGFDERFFLYWEDTDLCKRIKDAGWRVVYFPKARIFHSVGKSSETSAIRSIYHFHQSCIKLFVKHSKMPIALLMPFAFSGLTLRCLFVIASHTINRALLRTSAIKVPAEKKKIKILRIVSRLNIGGPSIHVSLLSKKINPQRFESILLTGKKSLYEGDMSYLMKAFNKKLSIIDELQREINPVKDLIAFLKIFLIIAREKPNIIHTHMSKAGTIGRMAAMCYKLIVDKDLKIVHTFHGHVLEGYFSTIKSRFFRLIEIAMARISDAVIAISNSQQWELTQKYKITNPQKVHIINLGLDLSPFLETYKFKGTLRKMIGIRRETLLIGIVGRLVPIKNHRMFLKSAKIFISRNPHFNVRFVIVGDGELRKDLEAYTEKLGIQDWVYFFGWEKELRKIYADLDILALTSINEGTPVSIIEAMAASVLVITTGVGGVKDLLGDFKNVKTHSDNFKECERGILCPKNNHLAFANGLQYIVNYDLYNDEDRLSSARDFVLQNYSDSLLIDKMEGLYENLIKNR